MTCNLYVVPEGHVNPYGDDFEEIVHDEALQVVMNSPPDDTFETDSETRYSHIKDAIVRRHRAALREETERVYESHGVSHDLVISRSWRDEFPRPSTEVVNRVRSRMSNDDAFDRIGLDFLSMKLKSIKYFWWWVRDPDSARNCADTLESYFSHEEELICAAKWLRFWADRNARFVMDY
jgi:hypothetical protein